MQTRQYRKVKIIFLNISISEASSLLFLAISAKLFKILLSQSTLIKNIPSLTFKEQNVCKSKVIQMKPFQIYRDISHLLLKINKFTSMQVIFSSKTVLMKTVCLLLAMELRQKVTLSFYLQKPSVIFSQVKMKFQFLSLKNIVRCLTVQSMRVMSW